jgi:cell division protein FtsQ
MRSADKLEGERRGPAWPAALTPAGFVLPRLLRRPARLLGRLFKGEWTPPRFAAGLSSAALIGAAALHGAYLGGHLPAAVQAVTARTGFAVDSVRVSGNRETSEIDILDRLGLDGWTSLVGFDAAAARARIAELPWVEAVAVRKVYPQELEVKVVEREAFAVWQHAASLSIIERSGTPIVGHAGSGRTDLPLVVGAGAAERAAGFVEAVARFPDLAARVKGYVRVGDRRWNLVLDNGVTVKLPEGGEASALQMLSAMDLQEGLFRRDVTSVDLRFADRVVLKLSPAAAEARAEELKQKAKPAKKTGVAPQRPKREKRA